MRHEWILDVLSDLRTFAERNDLPRLAAEIDDTRHRAALELTALEARDGRIALGPADTRNGFGLEP